VEDVGALGLGFWDSGILGFWDFGILGSGLRVRVYPRIAAGVFVCGPAAALVLVGQDDVDAVFQAIHRNRGSSEVRPHVLQSERRLEDLRFRV
jgi:hypothetical protein